MFEHDEGGPHDDQLTIHRGRARAADRARRRLSAGHARAACSGPVTTSGGCVDASGHVIGHVAELQSSARACASARSRYHAPSTRFRDLGEFWSADDAVACLRYSA